MLADAVCHDRLPRWEDLDNLPYVRCLMKEVWRVSRHTSRDPVFLD